MGVGPGFSWRGWQGPFIYFGEHQPGIWAKGLPKEDVDYQLDLIDMWNMTVEPLEKVPAPVVRATRHGEVVRGGKPDAAFAVEAVSRVAHTRPSEIGVLSARARCSDRSCLAALCFISDDLGGPGAAGFRLAGRVFSGTHGRILQSDDIWLLELV